MPHALCETAVLEALAEFGETGIAVMKRVTRTGLARTSAATAIAMASSGSLGMTLSNPPMEESPFILMPVARLMISSAYRIRRPEKPTQLPSGKNGAKDAPAYAHPLGLMGDGSLSLYQRQQ